MSSVGLAGVPIRLAVVTVLVVGTGACHSGDAAVTAEPPSGPDVVATVQGEPIVVSELLLGARHARTRASWPDSRVKQRALDQAVKVKLEQIMMRDQGLQQDVTYHGFLARWAQENIRRREAGGLGQPIYGPQQYGEQEYFDYLISNGILALKERFSATAISELELRQEYDAAKTTMLRRGRQMKIEVAQLRYGPGAPDRDKQTARATIEAIEKRIRRGETFAAASRGSDGLTVIEGTVSDARDHRAPRGFRDIIKDAALRLQVHETSAVLDTGHTFALVHCDAIDDLGYVSFEEARRQLEFQHRERAFDVRVQELVDRADVQIRREVYDRIAIQ